MKRLSLRSVLPVVFGLIAVLWLGLTLIALVGSITGGDPLYTAFPSGFVAPHLTLLGKVYLVTSMLMPFVVIGAIVTG